MNEGKTVSFFREVEEKMDNLRELDLSLRELEGRSKIKGGDIPDWGSRVAFSIRLLGKAVAFLLHCESERLCGHLLEARAEASPAGAKTVKKGAVSAEEVRNEAGDVSDGTEAKRRLDRKPVKSEGTLTFVIKGRDVRAKPCPNPGCCSDGLNLSLHRNFDFVLCETCGMSGPQFDGHPEDAMAEWNALPRDKINLLDDEQEAELREPGERSSISREEPESIARSLLNELDGLIDIISQGRKGYCGDHWIRTVQLSEKAFLQVVAIRNKAAISLGQVGTKGGSEG